MRSLAAALALFALVPSDGHAGFEVPERFAAKELDARLAKILTDATTERGKSILFDTAIEVEIRRVNPRQLEVRFPVVMHANPDRIEGAGSPIVTFQFRQLRDAKFRWELRSQTAKSLEDYVRRHAPGFTSINYIKQNPAVTGQVALSWTEITCKVFEGEAATLINLFSTDFKPNTRVWVDTWVNPEQPNQPNKSREDKRPGG